MLRSGRDHARVRCWPGRPGTAQLVLVDHARAPETTTLQSWIDRLAERGVRDVRTGAVTAEVARRFERVGFAPIQELVLLQFDLDQAELPRPTHRRAPLGRGPRDLDLAAAIDTAAFGPEWSLDPAGIREACGATPHHRARFALDDDTAAVGYAVTGRSGRRGFLQRLAVHPDHQRRGVGRTLVLDALRWLRRWRADDVIVNTAHDNAAARSLYERIGFRVLDEQLFVLERSLTSVPSSSPDDG